MLLAAWNSGSVRKQMSCTKSSIFFLILLKCMCFIHRHNYMVHSFIIHRFFQCIFANFCYQFQPFFVHMHRYFPWGFWEVLLKQFSQHFFIGFSRVFLSAIFLNFDHRFFHRLIFHRVLNFEIFSKFRLCKIHRVFHRVFTCHRVFHIFFTAFSQVFIQ